MSIFDLNHRQKMDFIVSLSKLKTDTCVHWPWAKGKAGYGMFGHDGKTYRVHRLVCALAHGDAPPDKPFALHSCDTPSCVNPRHLEWGDHAKNMLDKVKRQRAAYGKRNGNGVLSDFDVSLIRGLYENDNLTYHDLGEMFGVSRSYVGQIIRGEVRTNLRMAA
jgi:hypothetical protein